MANWSKAASLQQCPPGSSLEVVVAGRIVALFNIDGEIHALDGICPHQGGPLGQGQVQGCIVTCPWHGWQYDVGSGQHQSIASLKQPTIPVRVEDEQIFVSLD